MDGRGDDQGDGACLAKAEEDEASSPNGEEDRSTQNTQPLLTNESDSFSQEIGIEHFGYLVQLKPRGSIVGLMRDLRFSVGRGFDNSLVISGDLEDVVNISKLHFVLGEDPDLGIAWIMDHSSNGTFVNGQRLVKKVKKPLAHNDAIGLAHPLATNYVFVSASIGEQKCRFPRDIRLKYAVSTELGKGAGGQVMLSVRRSDLAQVAIKIIDKGRLQLSARAVWNEVRLLKEVNHPCIVRLEDVIDTEKNVYIALEFAEGGSLHGRISQAKNGCLDAQKAKLYFYQLLCAVEYLHSKGIAHRDLKPENILLSSEDEDKEVIKVADLGLAKTTKDGSDLRTFCGTNYYLAPEVVNCLLGDGGAYSHKCDMWSLGAVLYVMLSGVVPFSDESEDTLRQIQEARLAFSGDEWGNVSSSAVDLISKLMKKDVGERLSATEALAHQWMDDTGVIAEAKRRMYKASINQDGASENLDPAAMEPLVSEPSTSKIICRGANGAKESCQRK